MDKSFFAFSLEYLTQTHIPSWTRDGYFRVMRADPDPGGGRDPETQTHW